MVCWHINFRESQVLQATLFWFFLQKHPTEDWTATTITTTSTTSRNAIGGASAFTRLLSNKVAAVLLVCCCCCCCCCCCRNRVLLVFFRGDQTILSLFVQKKPHQIGLATHPLRSAAALSVLPSFTEFFFSSRPHFLGFTELYRVLHCAFHVWRRSKSSCTGFTWFYWVLQMAFLQTFFFSP